MKAAVERKPLSYAVSSHNAILCYGSWCPVKSLCTFASFHGAALGGSQTLSADLYVRHGAQWEKYHDEIWESLKALWSVWVPSQLVNFAFVPRHFRVPWGAADGNSCCCLLAWMSVLH
jgi:Mpv17 / PMP22 family